MKKLLIVILSVLVLAGAAFVVAGTSITRSNEASFPTSGYVLNDGEDGVQQLRFDSGMKYGAQKAGKVSFKASEGGTVDASSASFAHLDNDSVIAFSDGVLIDFNDLSDNFINNYYIVSGLEVEKTANGYSADSSAGTINFGDHVMKLSDNDYIVRSPKIKIHLNDKDVVDAEGFAEVHIDDNGLVHIVTADNSWTTISEDCYIETAGGVQVNPVTQIINDGSYMMSLAKLSVNPDDCIVLTEDETMRQVVPEFDIEAVDGKDGTAGGTGGSGASGSEGSAGGEGAQGSTGTTGKEGEDGKKGTAGETGGTGTGGESGKDGTDGSAGTAGGDGKTGSTGSEGEGGTNGSGGINADDGKNAVGDSSVFKALPQMSIGDWIATSTSLKGKIVVSGETEALDVAETTSNSYLGKVRIFNEETGEEIICYETNDSYDITVGNEDGSFKNFKDEEEIYFMTKDDPLEPDTGYRLVVTAYYTLNDSIYAREFLTRSFYTDSTGVFTDKKLAAENELTVRVYVPDSYQYSAKSQSSVSATEIYFLTAEQNAKFSAPGGVIKSAYTTVYKLDYQNGTIHKDNYPTDKSPEYDMDLVFDGLNSDTNYYVRSIVYTTGGASILSKQVLELKTLKTSPTWTDKPSVSWNRATGAFQVYRPDIVDKNAGITGYTYSVYDENNNVLSTRDISTQLPEPVLFYLQSNTQYRFGIKIKFNDNEKNIEYDIGKSEQISSSGDTLPNVTLESDPAPNITFNSFNGTIKIDLTGEHTKLYVDASHPLIVKVYSDEVAYKYYGMEEGTDSSSEIEIKLDGKNSVQTDRVTANLDMQSNEAFIGLSLNSLYMSSNYALTITGYLDLNDTAGDDGLESTSLVRRSIGTVSFRTKDTGTVDCSFQKNTVGDTIGYTLRLIPTDTSSTYTKDEIKKGKVVVTLYSGTGPTKSAMQPYTITKTEELTKIVEDGLEIKDEMFGQSLTGGMDYTLVVTSVSDSTGKNAQLGYTNTFDLKNETMAIVAGVQAPNLSSSPQSQIVYTAITNKEAAAYDGYVNEDLDDDVIVGYKLQAQYDNSARIAKSVTYYIFDYAEFYGTLVGQGKDPVGEDQDKTKTPLDDSDDGTKKLMTMTVPVTQTDTVPAVVVLFGKDKGWPLTRETPTTDAETYYNQDLKSYVYFSGSALSRGYKFIFAYTAIYNADGAEDNDKMYPYDMSNYDDGIPNYMQQYGAGMENGHWIGQGVAYVLNSGLVDCPRVSPRINSFLYSAESDNYYETDGLSTGTAVVYYTFKDLDNTIVTDKNKQKNTQIVYTTMDGYDYSQAINDSDYTIGVTNWFKYTMNYMVSKDEIEAEPKVLSPAIKINSYASNYYNVMNDLGYEPGNSDGTNTYYLCHVPVDFAYDKYIGTGAGTSGIAITTTIDKTKNQIKFELDDLMAGGGDEFRNDACARAYGMKLNFYEVDENTKERKSLVYTFNKSLSQTWDSYYVTLDTSDLSALSEKWFEVEGMLLYDTGNMGWKYAGADKRYGLQYINLSGDESDTYKLNDYVYASSQSTPKGMLLTQISDVTTDTLINNVELAKTAITVTNNSGDSSVSYYYYADHYGVDRSDNSVFESAQMSGRYTVPKAYTEYKLGNTAGTKYLYLDSITPTIDLSYNVSTKYLSITADSKINSDKLADDNKIYIRLYEKKSDATQLKEGFKKEEEVQANISSGYFGPVSIGPLDDDTEYYVTVTQKDGDKQKFLLKKGTTNDTVYEITTKSGVTISSTLSRFEYHNMSYFTKTATFNYSVDNYINFKARYDIYSTSAAAENKTESNLVMSYEKLKEKNIITAPETLMSYNNDISINLEPKDSRDALKPGQTYYVRITILESQDGKTEVGYKVYPLTISSAYGTRGMIAATDATGESITFQLTLNDYNHTVMGAKSGGNEFGPYYVVRFTKADGELLKTIYDDVLYSFSDPVQTFELNETSLTLWQEMEEQRIVPSVKGEPANEYQMHVYCVIDAEHNGKSSPINESGTTGDWEYFYGSSGKFQSLINSFWNENRSKKNETELAADGLRGVESGFELVSMSQASTTSEGYYISKENIYLDRATEASIDVVFKDSYGMIINGVNKFPKIDWSVKGKDKADNIINEQGSSYSDDNPVEYVYDSVLKTKVYKFHIPYELIKGNYEVQIILYTPKQLEDGTITYEYYESKTIKGTY